MIDTIHFELDEREHPQVKAVVRKYLVDRMNVLKVDKEQYLKLNVIDYKDKPVQFYSGFIKIPSNNYEINIAYANTTGRIKVNVSIPKYYYGNNILQYIITPFNYEWSQKMFEVKNQKEYVYHLLIKFLNDINEQIFSRSINVNRVIIKRIDFCYNLLFIDKNECDIYFQTLKNVRQKYLRETSNISASYKTSVFYKGDGYSFKIYKKGEEFKKNDRKQLIKRNVDETRIKLLEDMSERILRYEITFHNRFLSDIYNREFFRKNSENWKELLKNRKEGKIKNEKTKQYIKKCLNISRDFYIETSIEISESNKRDMGFVSREAKFSKGFVMLLLEKFERKIDEYALKNLELNEIMIRANNDKKFGKTVKKVLRLLQYETLESLMDKGVFHRATYYRYKKILKDYGIGTVNNSVPLKLDFSFERYINEIMNKGMLIKT